MRIRKVEERDIIACGAILKKAYSMEPYNEVFIDGNEIKYITSKYKGGKDTSFVMEDDESRIVWFSFAAVSYWANGLQGILEEIVVDPDYQWNWYGKLLYIKTEEYLKDLWAKSLMLWVLNKAKAVDFHLGNGFFSPDEHSVMFKDI